jgi:hypothetical protein
MSKRDSEITTRFLVNQPVLRKGKQEKVSYIRITLSKDGNYVEYTCGWGWQPEKDFKPVPSDPPAPLDICTWYDDIYGEVAHRIGEFALYLDKGRWWVRAVKYPQIIVGDFLSIDKAFKFIKARGDFLIKRFEDMP